MADYATLLRDHVTLTCRSVDRIFLQAYVPKLQCVGGVCQFLYWQKGFSIPSSAASARSATRMSPRCTGGRRRMRSRCAGSPGARIRADRPPADQDRRTRGR